MTERQAAITPKSLKLHPELLNSVLAPRLSKLPEPIPGDLSNMIDPLFIYDAPILNKRLSSIPLTGVNTTDISTIVDQVSFRQGELAFGKGIEGNLREIFTPNLDRDNPYKSPTSRFENPGEVWVLTADYGKVQVDEQQIVDAVAYGLMPIKSALEKIEMEGNLRNMSPDMPHQFEIKEVRILPKIMADYTRALQNAASPGWRSGQTFDTEAFRNAYFHLDPQKPDMTGVFKKIKQEYLGDTTWGTILFSELLIRAADYGIGLIPVLGSVWDFVQATTGKEFPLPGMERVIRHEMRKKNLPLPEEVFDKPIRGRLMELADSIIGSATLLLPPAWVAKVPIDSIIEGLIYVDKMHKTREYFKPFLEIATDTGAKPKAIDKIQEFSKLPPVLLKQLWGKIKRPK